MGPKQRQSEAVSAVFLRCRRSRSPGAFVQAATKAAEDFGSARGTSSPGHGGIDGKRVLQKTKGVSFGDLTFCFHFFKEMPPLRLQPSSGLQEEAAVAAQTPDVEEAPATV